MKVILKKNVEKLGKAGDLVEATAGHFRNFLEPQGLAIRATEGALKVREQELEAIKRKAAKAYQEACELGEKISNLNTLVLYAKAGESGKLYGKITNKEIAEALSKALEMPFDKRALKTTEDINALGSYKLQVKITPEVQVELKVSIVQTQ